MTTTQQKKQRGRPPAFDREAALEQAMRVFWARGYEGASIAELTEAMGINKPSLYAAFGSKEALFRAVLQKYVNGPVGYIAQALAEPTAYRVVERLLSGSIAMLTDPAHPRGCMIVQGALTCGPGAEQIRQELSARRNALEQTLRERFQRAKAEGDLTAETDAAALAKFVVTVQHGLSVQASSGAGTQELLDVVQLVLRSVETAGAGQA